MKFIALRDFYLTPDIAQYIKSGDLKNNPGIGKFVHEKHVHRGFIFDLGKADNVTEMALKEQELAWLLNYANCIGNPEQEVNFQGRKMTIKEKVKLDIEADEKKAKLEAERNEKSNGSQAIAALLQMFKGQTLAPAK